MKELSSLKMDVDEFVDELAHAEPSPGLEAALRAQIDKEKALQRARKRRMQASFATVLAAAAGVLLWTLAETESPVPEIAQETPPLERTEQPPAEDRITPAREAKQIARDIPAQHRAEPLRAATSTAPEAPAAVPSSGWRELADDGKFKAAVELFRKQGAPLATTQLSSEDCLALGEAARFAGDPQLALESFEKLHREHPQSAETATAIFQGARLHQRLGHPAKAIEWASLYLKTAPTGPLAREARGLRLELAKASSHKKLRAWSKDYLKHDPQGPHAPIARSALR